METNQLAADAYLALHKLVVNVGQQTDVTNEELTLEGESLIETFQGYTQLLEDAGIA
jgi:hypothetical protein